MEDFLEFGLSVPRILLPKHKDMSAWSVIACDQFTQDTAYWQTVKEVVSHHPSTLHLILPEVYLKDGDTEARVTRIRETMRAYLAQGVFDAEERELIYLERRTAYNRTRKGLVCALDLETYDWKPQSKALTRATEQTIEARIPPRKKIRAGSPLESPHILLLANDKNDVLMQACKAQVQNTVPVYDSDLMLKSGHVTGWAIKEEPALAKIRGALKTLKEESCASQATAPFLFAVGDGNHSLASAKAVWNEHKAALLAAGKAESEVLQSPVRYALVEIVNIYDSGLTFEPIHRVLFGVEPKNVISYLQHTLGAQLCECKTSAELERIVSGAQKTDVASVGCAFTSEDGTAHFYALSVKTSDLIVSHIQPLLDTYIIEENKQKTGAIDIDYIHGSDDVLRLSLQKKVLALLLPPIQKDSFFATIENCGSLPRKSFSMGEASEKRFYLECRRLFG